MALSSPSQATSLPSQVIDQPQRQHQQQLDLQREQQLKRPDVLLPPPAPSSLPAPAVETGGPCFDIGRVDLDGAPAAWQPWLQDIAHSAQGQCLGLGGVNALLARLNNAVLERGFSTSRVLLPEQNLKHGVLRFVVVPGRIHALRLDDGSSDIALRSAFPSGPGDILNLRDLEQGLEQLGRLRSQRATMDIVPADTPGESDVVVRRERETPLFATLTLDDSGQDATGKLQAAVALTLERLTPFNDVLSINWNQDARQSRHPRSRANSVSWLLPWGNWTAFASYSEYDYEQTVEGTNQRFTSSGLNRNTLFTLSRLLHRDQHSKTELALQLTRKASRSYIEDTEIRQQKRDLTLFDVELSHRHYLGAAVLDATLGYTQGKSWFGAMPDTLAERGGPSARPELFTARLSLSAPFRLAGQAFRASSELRGQYSPDLLMGSEQFSIGSRYTVRGFDDNSLSGQRGFYLRNELGWTLLPPTGSGSYAELYAGLDAGRVERSVGPQAGTQSLSGWTLGLRSAVTRALGAELSHERALHQPQGWPRPAITHFRLTLQY